MLIQRMSMLTKRLHTIEIPVTQEELDALQTGRLVQNVLPHLTAAQREFLITGITEEEWDATFYPAGGEK